MLAVFNRAISCCSSCTLWRNSSIVVATVRFYTRGVRAVHKTEHLSAAFGSIAPVTPIPDRQRAPPEEIMGISAFRPVDARPIGGQNSMLNATQAAQQWEHPFEPRN